MPQFHYYNVVYPTRATLPAQDPGKFRPGIWKVATTMLDMCCVCYLVELVFVKGL